MCHRCAFALIGLGALALAVTRAAGTRTVSEALSAMVITLAVAVPLALAGVLALVIMRARHGARLTYRPDPGITRARVVRVEIVATRGPEGPTEGDWRPVRVIDGSAPEHVPTGPEGPLGVGSPLALTRGRRAWNSAPNSGRMSMYRARARNRPNAQG